MAWWQICLVALSVTCMILALTGFSYICFKFAALIVSIDATLLRQFRVTEPTKVTVRQAQAEPAPIQNQQSSDTGIEYMPPVSDEEAFLNERLADLRKASGDTLSQAELDAFVRQAVGTDIGNQPKA